MLDFREPQDFASDEIDQREREMVTAMAPFTPVVDHVAPLAQQFFASPLDANDDDEHMTHHGYIVRTSTERINEIEARVNRIEVMLREWTGGADGHRSSPYRLLVHRHHAGHCLRD